MKRRKLAVCIGALIIVAAFALTACAGLDNKLDFEGLPDSYEDMKVAKGKSGFDIINEAFTTFSQERNYKRTQVYSFEALSGVTQDMQIKTVRKVNDGEIYNEEVVLAAGLMKLNEGKKVYFNGDKAYSLYFKDKNKVPGKGDDVFAVTEWIDFGEYDAERYGERAETEESFKRLWSYDLSDASYLASDSSDTVYVGGDTFYFTLTVDCSDAALKGVQRKVAETISKKTGGNPDDLSMLQNTTVQAAVKEIDGKLRIVYLKIEENFKGKLIGIAANCKNTYFSTFEYGADASKVTDAELGNLANG